eukprot:CAMPEP_0181442098 /NCGR_PEP_ID=MMETSP1110-20121109/23854_1 /TAXON_ID=174948 /ORGANISM="Symbiodinium sp., Strain CCMP421" /LENGTH=76 /DNA_ID=CAMNT_0023566015 /DNA_START=331 /DNA_END=561 /DNA_ORIENTATION=-
MPVGFRELAAVLLPATGKEYSWTDASPNETVAPLLLGLPTLPPDGGSGTISGLLASFVAPFTWYGPKCSTSSGRLG